MAHLLPDKPGSHWKRRNIEHLSNQDQVNLERKNGTGNVYSFDSSPSPGTLLDKWKEYTQGEDEETIIQNIYTPQTSTYGNSVVVAKKEQLPSDESREKLRDLRLKAMVREQEELNLTQTQFTSQQVTINYDTNDNGAKSAGSTYYAVPNQKVVNVEDICDDEDGQPKRGKERWYKKAHRIFKHTKHQ